MPELCRTILLTFLLASTIPAVSGSDGLKISFSETLISVIKDSTHNVDILKSGTGTQHVALYFEAEDDDIVVLSPGHLDVYVDHDHSQPLGGHNDQPFVDEPPAAAVDPDVPLVLSVFGAQPGRTTVFANTSTPDVDVSRAFVRVEVYQSSWLYIISVIAGWAYFICWSVCFYPQVYRNFSNKSVVGLSFDFVAISQTGFCSYTMYNSGLLWSDVIQTQYFEIHPRGVIPVAINDWFFAVHAMFITFVIIGQCIIYDRGGQVVSKPAMIFLAVVYASLLVGLVVALTGVITYLQYLYMFSYVKVLMTLIQYTPQAYLNYKRKSTHGWSLGFVWLDVFGGIFSISQMFIIAINYDDDGAITGNLAKLGLGCLTLSFDALFLVQHYCLYRSPKLKSVPTSEPGEDYWMDTTNHNTIATNGKPDSTNRIV